jgi:hypothetical protein
VPQEAPGGPQEAPGGPRRPQEALGSARSERMPPEATKDPRRPGGFRRPQEAPIEFRSNSRCIFGICRITHQYVKRGCKEVAIIRQTVATSSQPRPRSPQQVATRLPRGCKEVAKILQRGCNDSAKSLQPLCDSLQPIPRSPQ